MIRVLVCLSCFALAWAREPLTEKLVEKLSAGDSWTLPQIKADEAVNVNLSLLLQSFKISPSEGEWELTLWQNMAWENPLTTWSTAEFPNINQVALSSEDIWHPRDLMLYNQRRPADFIDDVQVVVYPTGSSIRILPVVQAVACRINRTNEGGLASTQSCNLKYGSWVYSAEAFNVFFNGEPVDLSELAENPCWELVKTEAKREEKRYDCCPELYPSLHFTFTAQLRLNAPDFCTEL